MHNTFPGILGLIVPLFLAATIATAAPSAKAAEDRYIAARDAAIEKISAIYDAGNADDAARKAEDAASADLAAQMRAILNEPARDGFGPAMLNIGTFSKGDEGSGTLDGLRFDARLGKNGETAGPTGADGKYVAPKAHIIVTTQTLFERWLRAHKEWWGNNVTNVPQQIGAGAEGRDFLYPGGIQRLRGGEFQFAADREASRRQLCLRRAGRANPIRNPWCSRQCVRLRDGQWQGLHRLRID